MLEKKWGISLKADAEIKNHPSERKSKATHHGDFDS